MQSREARPPFSRMQIVDRWFICWRKRALILDASAGEPTSEFASGSAFSVLARRDTHFNVCLISSISSRDDYTSKAFKI